jgi:5-methylcytosine-specific restriction enzyme A
MCLELELLLQGQAVDAIPMLRTLDTSIAMTPPRVADPELQTHEHRQWRAAVLERAGYCCQKCGATGGTPYADHIVERKDGGAPLDPANGQALCASCHTKKTNAARDARMAQ